MRKICLFLALLALTLGCSAPATYQKTPVAVPELLRQAGTDAEFVFDVYDKLEANFYAPARLSHNKLLNAALNGVANELEKHDTDYAPTYISASDSHWSARQHFSDEMEHAARISRHLQLTERVLAFTATAAMLEAVDDSHTYFIPPEISTNPGEGYVGIGVMLGKLEAGYYYFDVVFPGGPAEKAGLRRFDRLLAVDGQATPDDWGEIGRMIRGPAGAAVELTVERDSRELKVPVTRAKVRVPAFDADVLKVNGKKIGYLRLFSFAMTYDDLIAVLDELNKMRSLDGMVLDLRGNGGGRIDFLQRIAGVLLPQNSLIGSVKYRDDWVVSYRSIGGSYRDQPTVVLVNDGSASASEMMASAAQFHRRATVVGQSTPGYVGAGQYLSLDDKAHMMVTVGEVFSAKGQPMEKNGVVPDKEVALVVEDVAAGNDSQLNEALRVLGE